LRESHAHFKVWFEDVKDPDHMRRNINTVEYSAMEGHPKEAMMVLIGSMIFALVGSILIYTLGG
jgi:hypothetical protein